MRAALNPLRSGDDVNVDVVVEHVVRREVVLVVEAPARRQLLLRRVDGDVALAPAVEHRDVFGLGS